MNLASRVKLLEVAKRLQYFLFLSICSLVVLVEIFFCFQKFFSVPTYISSYITSQKQVRSRRISERFDHTVQAEFPEITLCRDNGGYKDQVLALNGIENKNDYSGDILYGSGSQLISTMILKF